MNKIRTFFANPIFSDKRFIFSVWMLVALIVSLKHLAKGAHNNYLIFEHVFYHTINQLNLYAAYPSEYLDTNHYGPVFSLVIAPFAVLPTDIGVVLWCFAITFSLFYAISKLPIVWHYRLIILYIPLHDLFNSLCVAQTNAFIAALIIGSFIAVRQGKDCWATCFIALGFFIKLYGIVGLAFFFFSKNKLQFIAYFLMWSVLFFVLPMAISSPSFIIQSYADWFHSLVGKNMDNAMSLMQDISVMGMARRISGNRELSDLIILIPGVILFALPYIRIKMYDDLRYQLGMLASTLLFIVLFSSGSEPTSYIIAMTGVGIWFILQKQPYTGWILFFLIFAIIFSSFSSSDLMPKYIRYELIRKYALKALPCLFVWLVLVSQLICSGKGFKKSLDSTSL